MPASPSIPLFDGAGKPGHVIHGRGHAEEAVKAHLEDYGKK